jgi:hypothetical protein
VASPEVCICLEELLALDPDKPDLLYNPGPMLAGVDQDDNAKGPWAIKPALRKPGEDIRAEFEGVNGQTGAALGADPGRRTG